MEQVRRVLKNGEEDDLRGALGVMIKRVGEMRGLIVERERIEQDVRSTCCPIGYHSTPILYRFWPLNRRKSIL